MPNIQLPSNEFPIGVWLAAVHEAQDVQKDVGMGLNLYVALTDNSDMGVVRDNGMHAILEYPLEQWDDDKHGPSNVPGQYSFPKLVPIEPMIEGPWAGERTVGPEVVGCLIVDEADMFNGPGDDAWTGMKGPGTCDPVTGQCGYTVVEELQGRWEHWNKSLPKPLPSYANYGKGVLYWETDDEARRFVQYTDVVSADMYCYDDPDLEEPSQLGKWFGPKRLTKEERERAANYSFNINRVRELARNDQAVWGFVELTRPEVDSEGKIPAEAGIQIQAAAIAQIIVGAEGLVYFNHHLKPTNTSFNILREGIGDNIRPYVREINGFIQDNADVLRAPEKYLYTDDNGLFARVVIHNDVLYVLAMHTEGKSGTFGIPVPEMISASQGDFVDLGSGVAMAATEMTRDDDGNLIVVFDTEAQFAYGAVELRSTQEPAPPPPPTAPTPVDDFWKRMEYIEETLDLIEIQMASLHNKMDTLSQHLGADDA